MCEVISVINMKGGVGKTTLTVNVAYVLSMEHSKKVLLIDIDPQFNASQYLMNQANLLRHFESKKTVYDILIPVKEEKINLSGSLKKKVARTASFNLDDYKSRIVTWRGGGYLDLIPSSLKLINFEPKRGTEYLLKKFIEKHCQNYDYVLIDCPPTLSILTTSAYLASDHYIIPIKPDYLSSIGLSLLERGLEDYEQTYDHAMTPIGIVFTLVDHRTNISSERMNEIIDSGRACFNNLSSLTAKVSRSVSNNITSLHKFYRDSTNKRYIAEFKAITKEMIDSL